MFLCLLHEFSVVGFVHFIPTTGGLHLSATFVLSVPSRFPPPTGSVHLCSHGSWWLAVYDHVTSLHTWALSFSMITSPFLYTLLFSLGLAIELVLSFCLFVLSCIIHLIPGFQPVVWISPHTNRQYAQTQGRPTSAIFSKLWFPEPLACFRVGLAFSRPAVQVSSWNLPYLGTHLFSPSGLVLPLSWHIPSFWWPHPLVLFWIRER